LILRLQQLLIFMYNIQMNYVVALGNPGEEYIGTRHNVGFAALDYVIKTLGLTVATKSAAYVGRVSVGMIGGEEVTMLFPETFMNHSGSSVKKLVPAKEAEKLIVLYDDVALPLGELRISFGRGDGGHNGIKSIIASLGTKDFVRVRIGVGLTTFWTGKIKTLSGEALPKFVLGKFTKREQAKLEDVLAVVRDAVVVTVSEGYAKAMNTYN
jgi:PTH1 family peptidyl-tRNA hydrolase